MKCYSKLTGILSKSLHGRLSKMGTRSFHGRLLEAKTKLLGVTNIKLHIKIAGSFWNAFHDASYESYNLTLTKAITEDSWKYSNKGPNI